MPLNWLLEDTEDGKDLVVTGAWSSDAADALLAGQADGLTLNYARGFVGESLDFLRPDWGPRRLHILDRSLCHLEPIARLAASLRELSVQAAPDAELDLSPLGQLHVVAGPWWLLQDSLAAVMDLTELTTWEFGDADLHAFSSHAALRRLTVKDAPHLASLAGIRQLADLVCLRIQGAPRLLDIDELHGLAGPLEDLWLEGCRALASLEPLEAVTTLRALELGDCGPVESFAPLAGLARLTFLSAWGSTQPLDGDLSPLLALPRLDEIRMRDRPTYSPRLASFVKDSRRIR
jgi:hypothetical protein